MNIAALQRAVPRPVLARALPFALFLLLIALADLGPRAGLDPRWIQVLRGPLIALVLLYFWRDYIELALPARVSGVDWALGVAGGVGVFLAWIALDADWMKTGSGAGFDPTSGDGSLSWPLVALRLFGLALVVPVMEELFWRSLVMRWLKDSDFLSVKPSAVGWRACAATAVLFALEHNLWLAGLLAGLVYNVLYMRSGNLWVPTLAHAVTNGLLGVYILASGRWSLW